jgi:hypothetical protein
MTLVEFLTARLDEDEAPTWTLSPYACDPGCCAPEGWVGVQCRYCDSSPVYGGTVEAMTSSAEEHAETIHQRSRVLRDVEAKRRVLDEVFRYEATIDAEWGCGHSAEAIRAGKCPDTDVGDIAALRVLAAVYADHPDYDEAWRP